MENRIEKHIALKAPVARVWRALTDSREFGAWFRVRLEGPFMPGQVTRGQMTYPGYEHVVWEATIEKMEAERLFSFTWPQIRCLDKAEYSSDYTDAPKTLVEFRLEPAGNGGTLLTVTESGFERMPADWRNDAMRRNEGGWEQQLRNIESHVGQAA